MARVFIDTNVLVYVFDGDAAEKQEHARGVPVGRGERLVERDDAQVTQVGTAVGVGRGR